MKREINREKGFTRADALVTLIVMTMIITTCLGTIPSSMNKARESAWIAICANQMRQVGMAVQSYSDEYNGFLPWCGGYDPNFAEPFNVPTNKSTITDDENHQYVAYRYDKSPWYHIDPNVGKKIGYAMRLACLYEAGVIDDPKIFYCPGNQKAYFRYESYCDSTTGSKKWGEQYQRYNITSGSNDWIRTGYSYSPIDKNIRTEAPYISLSKCIMINGDYVPRYTARRYENADTRYPIMTDVLWTQDNIAHKSGITKNSGSPPLVTDMKNPGVNALFIDGHVRFVGDEKFNATAYDPGIKGTIFVNGYWDYMVTNSSTFDLRYLLYNLFVLMAP